MENIVDTYSSRFKKQRRSRMVLGIVLLVCALVVALVVAWQLHYTGNAVTYYCGMEEHVHTEECYSGTPTCGLEECEAVEGHTHTEDCYTLQQELTCGMAEGEMEPHTHTEECYDGEELICGLEEGELTEHVHTPSCYEEVEVITCGKVECEAVEGHTHTAECYGDAELICTLQEHTHTDECLINENADLETATDWEATLPTLSGEWGEDVAAIAESQVGYTESESNFMLAEDGTHMAYTRYGAWAGNAYGDWNTLFAQFCLNYAGITEESFLRCDTASEWAKTLRNNEMCLSAGNYTPAVGDLVFFDTTESGTANRVAVVTAVDGAAGEDLTSAKIEVVEGASDGEVKEASYRLDNETVLCYGVLPQQSTAAALSAGTAKELSASKEDYIVSVSYGTDAGIPEDAVLVAYEYDADSDEYKAYSAKAAEIYGEDYDAETDELELRFFSAALISDGKEVQPEANVEVTVQLLDKESESECAVALLSSGKAQLVEAETAFEDSVQTVTFEAKTLSDFMLLSTETENGPVEDFDEEEDQTTDHITVIINWDDSSDYEEVRPGSVHFNLIYRTYYEEQNADGTLEYDEEKGYFDRNEDVIVYTVTLNQSDDTTGTGDDLWVHICNLGTEVTYNVFEAETYGASFYTYEICEDGDHIYTVTATLDIYSVLLSFDTQGGASDNNYKDGHYYHIDIRVDNTYAYIYFGDDVALVKGTDLVVTKNWMVPTGTETPDSITFYVDRQEEDGSTTPLYWDEDGIMTTASTHEESTGGGPNAQTVVVENERITLTIYKNSDGSWTTASIALDGGNYAVIEVDPDTGAEYETNIAYVTIDETTGDREDGNYYVHEGIINISSVNWVMYELNDNDDPSYVYYEDDYAGLSYGRLDGSYYTDPESAQSQSTGDYEFFLDDGNSNGGRGLKYLTDESTIWVNLDYTYTYKDLDGNEHVTYIYGYSFEFTPEEWIEANLCTEKTATNTQRGVDLLIDGDVMMELALSEVTHSEIDAAVVNTLEGETTTYLQGEKTWYGEDGNIELDHDNASELTLSLYRSDNDGATWEALTENEDYIVVWVGDLYYIYASGSGGVYSGLPMFDDNGNEYSYRVEEGYVSGYTSEMEEVENEVASDDTLYGTSYNFINTTTVITSEEGGDILPKAGGTGTWMYTLAGVVLIGGAVAGLMYRQKKRKGGRSNC